MEQAPDIAQLTAQLRELMPDVEFSGCLSEDMAEQLRSRLAEIQKEALEKQATFDGPLADAQKLVTQREEEVAEAVAEEKDKYQKAQQKAEELAEAQVEFSTAKSEHEKVERLGRAEREAGESLRQAKKQHDMVSQGPLRKLLEGFSLSQKAEAKAVQEIQEHLQAIGAEKTLIASVQGALLAEPEQRGEFDLMCIDSINEVMSKNAEDLSTKLEERAPAEREANAEMLGLEALMDVTGDKEKDASEAHSAEEAKHKEAKAKTRILKKEVTRLQSAVDVLAAEQELEAGKAKAASDAMASLETLVEVQSKRAAEEMIEEPAPKRARVEVEEGGADTVQAQEELPAEKLPEAAEAVMETEPKEAASKIEQVHVPQVASPARVRPAAHVTSPVA
eukprot:CAMPEP_0197649042 /NCGR_PEP_ID=MMETSP1338-20131121/28112_1 /TAXON_ID=43686 ORGANISM="Pelagodinium beii, Strain RCC1491" /NCGR_SAMPLE_ID=MMETSP1338 /ASSEMBLY_ACC=CAM_ASM_000754 /LENGTH=391 /DNA_ID=CAMNT_0043223141 /DNA_START=44 /DNA_END=1219 /DNA_ORIENTATION=+